MKLTLLFLASLAVASFCKPSKKDFRFAHKHRRSRRINNQLRNTEQFAQFWNDQAQLSLEDKLNTQLNTGVAKNVIMFMGDGMSIATLAATRMYLGNLLNVTGENLELSFEKFKHVGLSKTYCVDSQVADSACTATAYLSGVKGNIGTIGLTAAVKEKNCSASMDLNTHVDSIARWFQLKNKRTGLVTTTTVTHASPAGVYANVAYRDWESDADLALSGIEFDDCPDIAHQLIHGKTGKNLNVIMGGGRRNLLPVSMSGKRLDGRNLENEWLLRTNGQIVKNKAELDAIQANDTDYLMGLFASGQLDYYLDSDVNTQPTLAEMTSKAIDVLRKDNKGFFLFVEGGRIDHGHHENKARHALVETLQFSEAVQAAIDKTSESDTLIVVTSDHSHVMTLSGYPERGNDILGVADVSDKDGVPYSTLSYANGPGYKEDACGTRYDPTSEDTHASNYQFPAMVPLNIDTHGGEDVGIFARGPWSHLFTGVNEQSTIPHFMAYASCVGNGLTVCDSD